MKKLLLSLAGVALAALGMNAQSIYFMGSGTGLSWESWPGKEVKPSADGSYSVTIDNLSGFKMSTVAASNWDDFNAAAFGYSGTFGNDVFSTAGQTVSLEAWGENQDMPAVGSYTININAARTSMTVKANFAKPTAAPDVYIRGDMNGWGSNNSYKFTNTSWNGDSGTWTWTGTIGKGVAFKIADANWGAVNYTTNSTTTQANGTPQSMSYNGGNMAMAENFTGTITLNISNYTGHVATASFTPAGTEPVYPNPDALYIIGNVNGQGWSPDNGIQMTKTADSKFSITTQIGGEMGTSSGYFSFTEALSNNWDTMGTRYGASSENFPVVLGQGADLGYNGNNSFMIDEGYYTIAVDFTTMKVTVTSADKPIDPDPDEPTPNPGTTAVYVVGAGSGLNWDLPGKEFTGENGVVTFTLNNLVKFKVADVKTTDWDAEGTGFNANCWFTTSPFTDAVYPDGQTLPIAHRDDASATDQMVPWEGDYTITIDLNNKTMTAKALTPKAEGPYEIYLRGGMNDWGTSWQFTYNEATDDYTLACEGANAINAGVMFKIADAGWGTINYGYNDGAITPTEEGTTVTLASGGADMSLTDRFEGVITLKLTSAGATATFKMNSDVKPYIPESLYIIGDVENVGWVPSAVKKMSGSNGKFELANVVFVPAGNDNYNSYFSFCTAKPETDDWSALGVRYCSPEYDKAMEVEDSSVLVVDPDNNYSFMIAPGQYDVTVVFDEQGVGTVTIYEADTLGVNVVDSENGEAVYYDLSGRKIANPDKGIYIRISNGKASKVIVSPNP